MHTDRAVQAVGYRRGHRGGAREGMVSGVGEGERSDALVSSRDIPTRVLAVLCPGGLHSC
jgi:hypothetical protein